MEFNWWNSLDENAQALILFQTFFIISLCVCNFYLFFIIEYNNYHLMFGHVNTVRTTSNRSPTCNVSQ